MFDGGKKYNAELTESIVAVAKVGLAPAILTTSPTTYPDPPLFIIIFCIAPILGEVNCIVAVVVDPACIMFKTSFPFT